jgi:Fe-Mn family superoxide dismutase
MRPFLMVMALLAAQPLSITGLHAAEPTKAEPFVLPALPYPADALQPAIDQQTMEIHHGKHHRAYVDNLNAKVKDFPALGSLRLEEVLGKVSTFDDAVRNNAGGHYNHSLFWQLMAAPGTGGTPSAELGARLEKDFGSVDAFKNAFTAAAAKVFGSGWAWLVVRADGSLAIGTTPNQDNPLMDSVAFKGTPVLALDVWEHAYYLQYQNKRADYLAQWWNVVNWNAVNARFTQTAAKAP